MSYRDELLDLMCEALHNGDVDAAETYQQMIDELDANA